MAFGSFLGSSKWWYKVKYIFLRFYLHSWRSQGRKRITIVKVNLLEESHRNCDKISGCCQLYEIHTFCQLLPSPHFRGRGRGDLEMLGWFKKGGAWTICYFKGYPKLKGGAVTLKDTIHLENISFSLWYSVWWLN